MIFQQFCSITTLSFLDQSELTCKLRTTVIRFNECPCLLIKKKSYSGKNNKNFFFHYSLMIALVIHFLSLTLESDFFLVFIHNYLRIYHFSPPKMMSCIWAIATICAFDYFKIKICNYSFQIMTIMKTNKKIFQTSNVKIIVSYVSRWLIKTIFITYHKTPPEGYEIFCNSWCV